MITKIRDIPAFASWQLVLGVLLAGSLPTLPAYAQTPQKPNIVFVLTDNLGYGELGVYGGGATRGAPTPRIDKLAAACTCPALPAPDAQIVR